jgi:hypothetical protein
MKNKTYLLVMLIAFVLTNESCTKLQEEPTSLVNPDIYYSTINQAETVLTGSMQTLWDYWGDGYSWGWRYFINDDQMDGGDLNIPYNHAEPLWNLHYKNILNLNTLIKHVKAGSIKDGSPEDVALVLGLAKFIRGYNYFQLVRLYGDVPLYTDETEDPSLNPMARTPIAEVYSLIVKDFSEAADVLPSQWPTEKQGRPNKGAAKGLLAKAYLTMATAPMNATENYALAAQTAKEVMDDGSYSLIPDINDVFKSENKYASEKLWSFNANYNYLVVEGETWSPSELDGWNDIGADPRMDTLWPDQPRKDAYLLTMVDGVKYNELSSQRPTCRKWLPPNISQSDYENWTNAANCPIIRYADVLLIYAEAENKANNGPTQAACDAVNQVVDRANGYTDNVGHPKFTTALSVDEFDKRVIMERNWELCFEFDRWFDLVRKRILPENSPKYIQNFSEDDYLFPIPENDLRLNKLLVQNPGYPTP